MPSSISRDLRASKPAKPSQPLRPSSPTRSLSSGINVPAHLPHTPASPVIPNSSGGLCKVVGSLVEPSSSRNKWACNECGSIFARDSTIYVPPASAVSSQSGGTDAERFFCKDCYTDKYALGECKACCKPVLGSTKETGVFVRGVGGAMFHGVCFRCFGCDAKNGVGKDIMLDLNGNPSCEDCFGKIPKTATARLRVSPPGSSPSSVKQKDAHDRMNPTIAEMANRFGTPLSAGPRSRSASPAKAPLAKEAKEEEQQQQPAPSPAPNADVDDMHCAACGKGAFDGPSSSETTSSQQREVRLVTLPTSHQLHADCFSCAVCHQVIDAAKSFVRMPSEDGDDNDGKLPLWAHPSCAPRPPPTKIDWANRESRLPSSMSVASLRKSDRSAHPTHQRLPKPSGTPDASFDSSMASNAGSLRSREPVNVHSFIQRTAARPASPDKTSSPSASPPMPSSPSMTRILSRRPPSPQRTSPSVRQFKSSTGAAPPTRSTLNVHRPGGGSSNPARGIFAMSSAGSGLPSPSAPLSPSRADMASGSPATPSTSRYGGMQTCSGCSGRLTSLESVPGPAGSSWHRKCLVCSAPAPAVLKRFSYSSSSASPAVCGKQLDSFAKVREDGEVRCATCFREGK